MKKEDWYKLIVLVIVAVFVFQMISFSVLNQNKPAGGPSASSPKISVNGQGEANVTIVRYEPYVMVKGGEEGQVKNISKKLIDEGKATHAFQQDEWLVVGLKSGKDVPSAAQEFEKVNASVFASAALSTSSKIKVSGDGITTMIDGTSFTMRISPYFEEGEVVEAIFSASVVNGQIVQIENFLFLPVQVKGAVVKAQLTAEPKTEKIIEIGWKDRIAAKEKLASSKATYKPHSYIEIPQNASEQQLSTLRSKGASYITGIQPGIISVRNDFVDYERANADLGSVGLNGSFPPSIVLLENMTPEDISKVAEELQKAGIKAELIEKKTAMAALPKEIEWGGKKFRTSEEEVSFEQMHETEGGSVFLSIDFLAQGSRLSKVLSAQQVASGKKPS
ncbi:MAG: hypothetical protein N3G22_04505 [Candidatus Micrarchaeota archaeon]|nr:hypothetical protein [Candidatus Micrarchaeota archaeon]